MKQELIQEVKRLFIEKFGSEPLLVQSPGRINLIGEHTDYNNGFVLPAAINKYICIGIQKRSDNEIHLYSNEFKEAEQASLQNLQTPHKHWPVYILGVVDQLQKKGISLSGFNLLFDGNVPIGAGMSSSAAVECATIFALNELYNLQLTKIEMVKMAQMAEHEFGGVKCGIMDQFASMFGKKDRVIHLDCESLDYHYVPINLTGLSIVMFDSGVKHSLASSEYNVRRQQCEAGVALVQQAHPEVKSLRQATLPMLEKYVSDPVVFNRCKYVVQEIERLQMACVDLENADMAAFGKKMFETHYGLKDLYEVSCAELDLLIEAVKDNEHVLGARLMGGGFGGCTINLVKTEAVAEVIAKTSAAYLQQTGKELVNYMVSIEDGSALVTA